MTLTDDQLSAVLAKGSIHLEPENVGFSRRIQFEDFTDLGFYAVTVKGSDIVQQLPVTCWVIVESLKCRGWKVDYAVIRNAVYFFVSDRSVSVPTDIEVLCSGTAYEWGICGD